MSIIYNEQEKLFNLKTKNTSYIMGVYKGYLVHAYYGKKIEHLDTLTDALGSSPYRVKSFIARDFEEDGKTPGISLGGLPQEYPAYNSDIREPAFLAEFADGSTYTLLKYKEHKIYKGKRPLGIMPAVYTESDSEADSVDITLYDELKNLKVILTYSVFSQYDAITRSVLVINESGENVSLKKVMSASLDIERADFEMTNLYGAWAKERQIERKPIFHGLEKIDSNRGASSHCQNPFIALSSLDATDSYGDVFGFSLVYSGNFEASAYVTDSDETRVGIGINSFNFSWLLEPGEEFLSPEAVLVYSDKGFNKMSQTYHRLYRERLCRGKFRDSVRPVLINNWEATYFNFNEEKILAIAEKAKEAGIELFVLDDGWFGKRDSDNCSLGDWKVYEQKLPCGIGKLAEKINAMGMKFGLWFEPEMVSADSDLYREHPDWCIHIKGRDRLESRNQLILDFSRKEVRDHILDEMTKILSSANIEYVKWDMNRNMSEVGNEILPAERQRELPHRYMLGLYEMLEEITKRFPDVLFEGCSGGGGRFDPGMLYYFPQIWTSDDSDAIERLYIQEGTYMAYPACSMGAHVSAVPNHQVGRVTSIDARAAVAMTGQFGYELDLNKLSDEEFDKVKGEVALYKELSPVIREADYSRIKSVYKDHYSAWEFNYKEGEKAVLMICETLGRANPAPDYIKLTGLDPDAMYKERFTERRVRGEYLMNVGLIHYSRRDFDAKLLIFEKE